MNIYKCPQTLSIICWEDFVLENGENNRTGNKYNFRGKDFSKNYNFSQTNSSATQEG